MPGRIEPPAGSVNRYKYGFNGKENDKETVGTGEGTQDYGLRIYNPALGKFLSVDPLTKSYPFYTPYQFAGNKPIRFIDLDGAEEYNSDEDAYKYGAGMINDAIDGLGNVLLVGTEWAISDKMEGYMVRAALTKQNYSVHKCISDEELAKAFSIRKENRTLTVIADDGVSGDLLSVGLGALDIACVMTPGKGGGAFMAIKSIPISREISSLLKSLKLSARTQALAKEIDIGTKQLGNLFESQGGAIIEDVVGGTLRRTIGNEAGDFRFITGTHSGKTLDMVGIPVSAAKKFDMNSFTSSIKSHMEKSVDFIGVDIRNISSEQKKLVKEFIEKNYKGDSRIITLE